MTKNETFYAQFNVKHYAHWTLRIEVKQRYLGQAVVWLEREGDMQRLSSLQEIERAELWDQVLPEYEKAVAALWQPNHMNYAWLGNDFELHGGHGHLHVIPRYSSAREFGGTFFKDDQWGKNYAPYMNDGIPLEKAIMIRDALREEIPGALTV